MGDIGYETASGGETPESGSPSPDPLNIGNMLIYAFQEEPQMLKQALKTANREKWLAASQEEYDNLIKMGTWKLVSLPHDKKPIKCRWRYVIKADGRFKAMDVKTAFLYRELKEEIYMEQPEGFVVKGQEKKVCKLVKSIYRLKQARQVWYELMADTLRRKLCQTGIGIGVHRVLCIL